MITQLPLGFLLRLASVGVLLSVPMLGHAQTGIGTRTPDPSAALDISSSNRGLLRPRVALKSATDNSTVEKPATGLMIFNISNDLPGGPGLYYNAGGASGATGASPTNWVRVVTTGAPVGLDSWQATKQTGVASTAGLSTSLAAAAALAALQTTSAQVEPIDCCCSAECGH